MSHRDRDLRRVSEIRAARERAVNEASSGSIEMLLGVGPDDDRSRTYIVKLLDVTPGVGKVAGRRLLAAIGIGETSRIADLDDTQRASIIEGIGSVRASKTAGGQ